jgi:hypothetical protein
VYENENENENVLYLKARYERKRDRCWQGGENAQRERSGKART